MSSRRLLNLIHHLPATSQVSISLNGEASRWSITDHLLAQLIDSVRVLDWHFCSANSEDSIDPPVPIPRPGVEFDQGDVLQAGDSIGGFFAPAQDVFSERL